MLDHGQKHDDQYEMFDSKEDVIRKMIRKKLQSNFICIRYLGTRYLYCPYIKGSRKGIEGIPKVLVLVGFFCLVSDERKVFTDLSLD